MESLYVGAADNKNKH